MLTELRFENFKSWRDTGVMRMAPLTGFFGTNSSGKTAILQFLLMLKQTVESNDQSQVLNFGNEHTYVDLGTAANVIHKKQLPSSVRFSLTWNSLHQGFPKGSGSIMLHLATPEWIRLSVDLEFGDSDLSVKAMTYSYPVQDAEPRWIGMKKQNSSYFLDSHGIQGYEQNQNALSAPMKMYGFSGGVFEGELFYSNNTSRRFEQCFANLYYLGPIRDYPKRSYGWSGEKPQDVGRRGENTIAALLTARKQDPEIEIKIAHWLKAMGLIDDFKVDLIAPEQRLYQASVRIAPGGTYCPITDVGFGVSQILPVLVLCYYVPKGSTIIFEQPEIHLHPSAQQKLADVFIDVIKHRELQIIIESHSEHLLHRLQRRIAENGLTDAGFEANQAALYFCQMGENGASQLTELALDEFGNIENWPKDFFGDRMGDLLAMSDAEMQRQPDGVAYAQ
jgi:predicted ATPase